MQSIPAGACTSIFASKGRRYNFWAVTTSISAIAAAMFPSAVHAQVNTDDETIVTEVVAIEGQALDGEILGGFLPVVIGGEGDLLFLSQTANNSFITFDGNLDIIADARPFGSQNVVRPTYSIDSFGDQFALTTQAGIFTGSVSDNIATQIAIGSALDGVFARDLGNLGSGATPIILNQQTALLLSDVAINEPDGSFLGNTGNFALFAGANDAEFSLVSGFSNTTSLNFAGPEGLFSSSSPLLSAANSAQTSNLFLLDLNDGPGGVPLQVGPNGNPQLANGAFAGGDFTFAGFTFVDNTGGNFIGSGANFDARSFSANSASEAFVLGNALLGIDGGPGDSLPGELLVFDDQVIAVGSNFRLGVQTSVGEVAFRDFGNVILAENGDLFFTAETSQTNGQPLADPVGIWRVINPGLANQAIVPGLATGDELIIAAANLSELFPGGNDTSASVAGFDLFNISLSQGAARDGRPALISVNEQGHLATVVQIDSASGPVEAIVAQDDNGDFHVVAFIGQMIDIDGQGDLRRITNFTGQFGSNDIDGAGDLFNIDEQLGFVVTLDREATNAEEFDQAIFRVSLNGITVSPITDFLWQGGCGDDEFSTRCEINAENASNWVDANDISQISADPPGSDPGQHSATIRGADIRISVENVNLATIESDSTITLQDGRTLTLAGGGDINRLVIERGTITTAGTLNVDTFQIDFGTVQANGRIIVEDDLTFTGGRLEGAGGIDVQVGSAIQSTPPQGLLSGNLELATQLRFFDSSDVTIDTATLDIGSGGQLELNDGSNLTIKGATIVGEGSIVVESEGSSIISEGLNFVTASLNFQDANAVRSNEAEDDLLRVVNRTLSVNELIFSVQNATAIVANQGAGVAIDRGATLELAAGGSMVVQSFVEFSQTDGSMGDQGPIVNFGNGSTLGIDRFGTALFNLGEGGIVNLDRTTVTGGGLLANRSALNAYDSNFAVVFANLGTATFGGNNVVATSEVAATAREDDELFRRGVEAATGVDIGAGGSPILISALLNDVTYTGGNNMITGDGAAFLIDNTLQGGRLDSTARTLIAGDITLNNQAVFAVSGAAGAPAAFAVLATAPEPTFDASATFNGNGRVLLESAEIQGLIAPNNAQFQFANLTNRLGVEFLAANPDVLNSFAAIDPSANGLLQIGDSSLDNLGLVNEGAARLENVTFLQDSLVFNAGLLNIAGLISDNSESGGMSTALITNDLDARLQLTSSDQVDVAIENFGLITVSGGTIDVTLAELFTAGINESGEDVFGFQGVNDGASLTVNSTDSLFVSDDLLSTAGAVLSAGWFVEDGTVTLLGSDSSTPSIDTIDASGDVEIVGTGKINNLDANGSGLRTVNGIFIGSGGFQGGDIDIGQGGGLAFDQDSRFDEINIASEGELNVIGEVIFSDALVNGSLIAENIMGDSLVIDGPGSLVDVTSVPPTFASFTVKAGDIDVRGGATLLYRGTIDADVLNISGSVTSDDFEASNFVERIQADSVNIFVGGTLAAEELGVNDTLTIQSSGRFEQVGTAELTVNNLELDGVLQGSNIFVAGDLRVGESGMLNIADTIDSGGSVQVDGVLVAENFRANVLGIQAGANLRVSNFFNVGEDIIVDGILILAGEDEDPDVDTDPGTAAFGSEFGIGANGAVLGEADIDAEGAIQTASGGQLIIEGVVLGGGDVDLQGQTGVSVLGAGADITVGGQTVISGTEEADDASRAFARGGFSQPNPFGFALIPGDFDLVAGGDLTVQQGASLAVNGGTAVGGSFTNGGTAHFDGDFFAGSESDGTDPNFINQADAAFDLSGNFGVVGGFQNLGDFQVGGDVSVDGDIQNEGSFRFGQSIVLGDDGVFENSGTLIGGDPQVGLIPQGRFVIEAATVVNLGFIGGAGTIDGDFLQEASADNGTVPTFSPGFSPGIINITGDATFNDGVVLFEIGGLTPGTEHDQINVTGDLTIGSNAMIVVDLLELDDGSGIFLPQTGDEIVIFTAADISPDDVEQIDFSVIDDLPLGFTLLPDIVQTGDGEIFRVLRGFNGSNLATLDGLDPAQLAVAGAVDFISAAESGVPSPELFQLAVDLQFTEDRAVQLDSLTALSSTPISAIQSSSMRAGSIGLNFAESRLRHHAVGWQQPIPEVASRTAQTAATPAQVAGSGGVLNNEAAASMVAQRAAQGGGSEYLAGNGSVFRVIGSTSYMFGDSASRLGTTGFNYDGWSANAGVEFEGGDRSVLLGVALGLGNVGSDLDDGRGNVEADSLTATIYGQYQVSGFTIAAGYSIADLDIESQRQVLGASASGETSGKVHHAFSRLGFDLIASDSWRVGPEVSLVHSELDVDGFSETGAGPFNLSNASLDRDSTRLNLLGTAARQFDAGSWSGLLAIGAGYQWALAGDEFSETLASFVAAPTTRFANPLRPLENSGFDLSTDLSLGSESGLSIALEYDGFWGETGQDSHDLSFKVSVVF